MYVYELVNRVTGERYVGITSDFKKRVNQHKRESRTERSKSRKLYANIREYGTKNFYAKILEETDDLSREKYWIDKLDTFNNGLNHTADGSGNKIMPKGQKKIITRKMEEDALKYYEISKDIRKASSLSKYPSREIKEFLISRGVYKRPVYVKYSVNKNITNNLEKQVIEKYAELKNLAKVGREMGISMKNVIRVLDKNKIDRVIGEYDRKKSFEILKNKELQKPFYRITKKGFKTRYENITDYRKRAKKTIHSPYMCLIEKKESHNGYKFEFV